MADRMTFPPTFEEFIKQYEFKDEDEVYTNGAELIPSFRVMQAWDHYTSKIKGLDQNIMNIYDCLRIIESNIIDIEDEIDEFN